MTRDASRSATDINKNPVSLSLIHIWGALAGVAAKETVLAHFQYTSDFPVASDRSVMGNEPKPPNRPMSMSNVSVTVTSSLS